MKKHRFLFIILMCTLTFTTSCKNGKEKGNQNNPIQDVNTNNQYKAGSICTIEDGENGFGIVKVLVVENGGVHVKIYKNKFNSRPDKVDLNTLSLGSISDPDGFGIGHVPLEKAGFDNWKPVVIAFEEVKEDELEGYLMWKNQ